MSASTDFYFLRTLTHNLRVSQQSQDPLQLRRSVAASHCRVGFNSRLVHVGFEVDQMVLGQVSLPVLQYPSNIILLMLHTTISFAYR